MKKILTLTLTSSVLLMTACSSKLNPTPPILTPVVVQCQIPPMPIVYKSSVDYSKLVFAEQDYLAIQADKLNNSVKTLQEWGNMVIENSKQIASKGDKSE